MAPISIRLDRVSKRFDHTVKGEVYAVRDVSLAVEQGELLTLLGPSGCGKSTTLRMIAGFEEPDEGTIFIEGQDVTHVLPNRRGIGFMFQNYALFPHLTVFENVAYGLRVQGRDAASLTRSVEEVLELVGLANYGRQQPHQLSGGEQQRVALARAVVFQPKVLLFDEPLSNLDAKLRVEMREQIRSLQKRIGITTVYVTHDQEEAMAISDRIAVMERGVVVQDGTAQDLYYRPATEFVARFIGRTNLLVGTGGDGGRGRRRRPAHRAAHGARHRRDGSPGGAAGDDRHRPGRDRRSGHRPDRSTARSWAKRRTMRSRWAARRFRSPAATASAGPPSRSAMPFG